MKAKLLLALVLTLVLPAACCLTIARPAEVPPTAAMSRKEKVDLLRDMTVSLVSDTTDDDGDYMPYCAGVWVNPTMILTAYHCAASGSLSSENDILKLMAGEEVNVVGRKIHFRTFQNILQHPENTVKGSEAVVIAFDSTHDMALLMAMSPAIDHSNAKVSLEGSVDGDDVHIIGHTGYYMYSYAKGTVAASRRQTTSPMGKRVTVLQIAAPIWKGNSGGGAFDDHGDLTGLCSFVRSGPFIIGFFIRHDDIAAFLERTGLPPQ